MADPILDTAILLNRVEQVRTLARLLVADDATAEDVAQDALVVALKRGDESAGPLPAWLRSTVRSLASRVRRANARRIRREYAAARSEILPSTAQLCERASVQRTVVDAVIELEEPYRTAILLRYFEGLLPAEIAGHLRVPVATVKKRLSRGRERLRARLERRLGPEIWSALVLPLALRHPSPAHVAQATGVLLVSSNLKLIVSSAIVLVLVALTVVLQPGAGPSSPEKQLPVEAAQLSDLESPSSEPTHITPVGTDGERVAAEPSRTETDPVAEAIEGRVINGAGEPVPGVTVLLEQRAGLSWKAVPNTPTAVTDALGVFRVAQAPGFGRVGVTSERYVTVIGPTWSQRGVSGEPTIVVGERSSYSGIVVDREGNPIPGAVVIFRLESAVLRKLFQGEERPLEETWIAFTGAGGEFAMRDIGWLPGTMLIATLDPFERADVALDPGDFPDLQVVLERPTGGQNPLHGRVVLADGGSVVGAQVAYAGGESVACAPDGTFVLDLGQDPTPGVLLAVLGGYLPARLEISDPLRASESSRAAPVELQLEGYALSIAGNVVDAAGAPVEKAWVWSEDGARFSRSRAVEDVAAIDTKYGRRVGRRAEVDREGKFEIKGLLDAQYDIYAVHPETFRVVQIPGVNAGSRDVRFVFDDESPGVRVAGRVLYRDGEPAPRVHLYPQIGPRSSSGLGRPPFLVHSGRSTDAEGRFEFPALCTEGMRLWVTGTEIGEPAEDIKIELEGCADVEQIEIRVPRVVRFEVVLRDDPDQADRFGVADGDGRLLGLLHTLSGAGRSMMTSGATMRLSAGRSEVVSCSEDVRTLILYRGDEAVRRIPVSLKVGELTVLEL